MDDAAIRDLVVRLSRPHSSGGKVSERAAILAEGAGSADVVDGSSAVPVTAKRPAPTEAAGCTAVASPARAELTALRSATSCRPARSIDALDPIKERVQRRRSRLRPLGKAVAAGRVVVGSYFDRARRPGLNELNIDAPALQRPVGEHGRDCRSGWLFGLAHQRHRSRLTCPPA
jgi:hypothetical protein